MQIIPIILAGGIGTRLSPLSTASHPKQFIKPQGGLSYFQQSLVRAQKIAHSSPIIVVSAESFEPLIHQQISEISAQKTHLILEPNLNNTACAIAVSASYTANQFGANTLLWVIPSDHVITNDQPLIDAVASAAGISIKPYITLFGIAPHGKLSNHYGYIEPGITYQDQVSTIKAFYEKPAQELLLALADQTSLLINSGMLLATTETILHSINQYAPHLYQRALQSAQDIQSSSLKVRPDYYHNLPSISFDKLVLEHHKQLLICPVDIEWSDIGTWDSLWEYGQKDSLTQMIFQIPNKTSEPSEETVELESSRYIIKRAGNIVTVRKSS